MQAQSSHDFLKKIIRSAPNLTVDNSFVANNLNTDKALMNTPPEETEPQSLLVNDCQQIKHGTSQYEPSSLIFFIITANCNV
jgi:hypothetical protein